MKPHIVHDIAPGTSASGEAGGAEPGTAPVQAGDRPQEPAFNAGPAELNVAAPAEAAAERLAPAAATAMTSTTGGDAPPAGVPLDIGPRYLAKVEGWGMAVHSYSYVYHPTTTEEILELFALARRTGQTIAFRGGGRSYGDAAINTQGIVVSLRRMNRILDWNPDTGIIETQPGVTIENVWQHIVPYGWWLPVVSGTMFTTMAGCASMNIHGKNNFKMGTFGEHILEFELATPAGERLLCSPTENSDLYYGAISGFGMLGCITRLKIQMKKIYSGQLRVEAFTTSSIGNMIDEFRERVPRSDYLVGWIDGISGGRGLGRGVVHQAHYLHEGEDPRPHDFLTVSAQELPGNIMGVFPKSMVYLLITPFTNNLGMRFINAAKYYSSHLPPRGITYYQSHAAFAFLLDYVPHWKWAYKPGGLIQYQSFLPKATAKDVYEEILRRSHAAGIPPYLGVFKQHKPDPFLLTHALDGYSLALDYPVTAKNRSALWRLCAELDEVVLAGGGKFYFAKDLTLRPAVVQRFFPPGAIDKFVRLKQRCDPEMMLQTDLSRRLFSAFFQDGPEKPFVPFQG